jgi:hypothetical protein
MAYAPTIPAPHAAFVSATKPKSSGHFWRRLYRAMITSRQRQADREIAHYVEMMGGTLTDHTEREIERRFLANRSY